MYLVKSLDGTLIILMTFCGFPQSAQANMKQVP